MLSSWLYQLATETSQIDHNEYATITLLCGLPNSGRHQETTYKTALLRPNLAVLTGGHFFLLPTTEVCWTEAIDAAVESTLRDWWKWVATPWDDGAQGPEEGPIVVQDSPVRRPPQEQAARKNDRENGTRETRTRAQRISHAKSLERRSERH